MFRKTFFAPLLAASAMALSASPLAASPAHGGKADRARSAIAAAEAKIHTVETMDGSSELPRETAQARAALAVAKERLASGDKSESIDAAIHASALADTAIGIIQRRQDQALADAQARNEDVAAAQDQAAVAQQQAAAANQRAALAEQHAANSAAEASAARNAAMIAAQTPPAEVETTVTSGAGTARPVKRHVVRKKTRTTRHTATAPAVTTTTTISQAVN